MTDGLFFDVERVEVLKGPQGTLFGQNATGGSINVIAAKPTRQFAAGLDTSLNSFGEMMFGGFVSGPITDTLRVRLAATTTQLGAWQKGYYLAPTEKNGDQNKAAARLLLDWTPTDELKVSANVNANYDHGQPQQPQFGLFLPYSKSGANPALAGYPATRNNRDAEFDPGFDPRKHSRTYQAVLRGDLNLTDALTLTSLTNYVNTDFYVRFDEDASALPGINEEDYAQAHSFSQELRLTGKALDNRLTYIVGGNYQRDAILDGLNDTFLGFSALPPNGQNANAWRLTNKATGGFADVDFDLLPRLTLTGGLRYTTTTQSTAGCTRDGGNGISAATFGFVGNLLRSSAGLSPTDAYVPGGCFTIGDVGPSPQYLPTVVNISQDQSNVSWRGGVNFKPTADSLIYALVSRGFKAGVFPVQNTILESQIKPVRQEQLTSYEVGYKAELLEHTAQFSGSLFYYDYLDKQFYTYVPTLIGAGATIVNIPKSKVQGVDLDLVWKPWKGLTLHPAVTYIQTKVGDYHGYDIVLNPVNFSGNAFNYAPAWSGTFDGEYRFPMNDEFVGFVGAGALYNSSTFSDLGENPITKIPSYLTVDARAGIEARGGWHAWLWVRNLGDKYYWTGDYQGGDVNVRMTGLPRTFGVSAGVEF
jgi:iron complex outermembrane receptor protein